MGTMGAANLALLTGLYMPNFTSQSISCSILSFILYVTGRA